SIDRRLDLAAPVVIEMRAWKYLEERGLQDEPAVLNFEGIENVLKLPLPRVHQRADQSVVRPFVGRPRVTGLRCEMVDGACPGSSGDVDAEIGADAFVGLPELDGTAAPKGT